MIYVAVKKFPLYSELRLFYIIFLLDRMRNTQLAMRELAIAEQQQEELYLT